MNRSEINSSNSENDKCETAQLPPLRSDNPEVSSALAKLIRSDTATIPKFPLPTLELRQAWSWRKLTGFRHGPTLVWLMLCRMKAQVIARSTPAIKAPSGTYPPSSQAFSFASACQPAVWWAGAKVCNAALQRPYRAQWAAFL